MQCPVCSGDGESLGWFDEVHWYVCKKCAFMFDTQTKKDSYELFYEEDTDAESNKHSSYSMG